MPTPSPRCSLYSPSCDSPPVFHRRPSIEESPSHTRSSQTTARALTNFKEYSEAFPVITEGSSSSRSTSSISTTNAPSPRFPFRESYESATEMNPPPLSRRRPIPLPTQCDSEAVPHRLLLSPRQAGLHWDLLWSHESVESVSESHRKALSEPATFPGLPSMSIVHPWLPWPITVHASDPDSGGVSVADVLVTISKELLLPVGEQRSRIRLDFLRGRRIFLGLRTSQLGGDVWELVVD
ncbi:Mitogen-Activated Protein Kinase Kinase Kinase 8 [Marasmius tenuissimus]|uniref:Mitogen-Activated Protein Kinase Kinase Kinase 8 n=1 Tax=Marasmius tenuissimus TaxID=585030 RepID=A0ABR2ZS45_9AGAR|nr:MAP kinase kinase kinase kinase activity protein [Marasmius tenuissimus]